MTHRLFGLRQYGFRGYADELKELHNSGVRIDNPIALDVLLSQAYDVTYGIFDYDRNPNRPMAAQAVHPAENLTYKSSRRLRVRQYLSRGILARFGLDITEFLELSRQDIEMLLEEAALKNDEDLADAERAARNALQGAGRTDYLPHIPAKRK